MKDLNLKQIEEVLAQIEDYIIPSPRYVDMMCKIPIWASFCDANKPDVSRSTIILMAVKYLRELWDMTNTANNEYWVKTFKDCSLKYMLEN